MFPPPAMETMTATKYPITTHNPTSSYPTSATRATQHADTQQPNLSAPASQESFVSVQSSASSVAPPRLQASDSNLSQATAYTDTDLTSPSSSAGDKNAQHVAHNPTNSHMQRNRTPENGVQTPHLNGEGALASPMSIASPVATNGAKRTASGHVKNAPSLGNTPYGATFPGRESRRESISSTGSRAGELAATLKTRLGYAMAKVQHGWEHKSLQEVEQLAAHKARTNRYSMSHVDHMRPGTSGLSDGTANLSMFDPRSYAPPQSNGPPPSKRHSGNYSSMMYSSQYPAYTQASAPRLQPAPDIRPTSYSQQFPPPYSRQPQSYNNAMSPPRTPLNVATRPPTIRTETQTKDAEMDALQALIGLGSPHTSQMPRSATTASSQASPQKMNLDTPRRVTFARSESNSSSSSGPASQFPAGVREDMQVR